MTDVPGGFAAPADAIAAGFMRAARRRMHARLRTGFATARCVVCIAALAGTAHGAARPEPVQGVSALPEGVSISVVAQTKEAAVAAVRASSEGAAEGWDLPLVWSSRFAGGLADWNLLGLGWGLENRSFGTDREIEGQVFRVFVPAGSIDPGTMKARGLPYGGTGFKAVVASSGLRRAILRYKVRFPVDFEPARGGKLPGLCGGTCNGGGKIPNGTDGFSARYMWRPAMGGQAYLYLPTSVTYGTGMNFVGARFPLGRWVVLTQELKLNTPGAANGWIQVWLDGQLVLDQRSLRFRDADLLGIDRLYFDVFYGGNDDTWAAPKDTVIEFAEFDVYGTW